jgi:PKD repeat protein
MRGRAALCWALLVALVGCDEPPKPAPFEQECELPTWSYEDMPGDMAMDMPGDMAPEPLVADAGAARYAFVGEEVVLDGSGSRGAASYQWDFGDGTRQEAPSAEPVARIRYAAPGRYQATLTAFDAAGRKKTARALITATRAVTHAPRSSASVVILPGSAPDQHEVAALSEDAGEVSIFARSGMDVSLRVRTGRLCARPRTLAAAGARLAVACQGSDELVWLDVASGEEVGRLALPVGSRPYGVVASGDALFVTLQGTGQLARVEARGDALVLAQVFEAVEDARAVALMPDGRLLVSRWRSSDVVGEGELVVVDPESGARQARALPFDPQLASDTEIGGVPNYLNQIALDPTGELAVVASTQANTRDGLARSGVATEHDTMLRAVLSWSQVESGAEAGARTQLDNRGMASAAVFNARGDYLYATTRGSRTVERIDVLGSRATVGTVFDVGLAPEGLALSPDDALLFVDASLSRELVVLDVRDWRSVPEAVARLGLVSAEPLDEQVLAGKRLFNDSMDTRLARDGYLACAHCHMDGEHDGRTWDFTQRGEGLRNTTSLVGRAGMGDGPVHWSANFDEIQDFEADIRLHSGGTGLMEDADWEQTKGSMGAAKAGRSASLDALAAYVGSLGQEPPSPHRMPDGSLPEAAQRGRAIFESVEAGCAACHAGARLTDSALLGPGMVRLHDVGTLTAASGMRLGGALEGLDTPTLHGLFRSAPYLHDGSAATLREVLVDRNAEDRHGVTSALSAAQIDDLVAYLLCLDGRL